MHNVSRLLLLVSSAALPPSARLPSGATFQTRRRPESLLLIVVAHVAAIWLFLQADVVAQAVHQVSPIMVALLSEPAPPRPPEPSLPKPSRNLPPPPLALMPPPEVQVVQTAPPAPPPAAVVVPVLPTNPPPVVQAISAPTAPAPVQAAAAPPPPPVLPASAIRYRVEPPVEVPLASKRLRESGTVLLRVLVDAQGLPKQITLHKSSGFARLDEQALAAMRQARFQALNNNGSAIEWVVIAPLQYDVD